MAFTSFFGQPRPIDYKPSMLSLNQAGDSFNAGIGALKDIIKNRQDRSLQDHEIRVKNNDAEIAAKLQAFNKLSALQEAEKAGNLTPEALAASYEGEYTRGSIPGLIEQKMASLEEKQNKADAKAVKPFLNEYARRKALGQTYDIDTELTDQSQGVRNLFEAQRLDAENRGSALSNNALQRAKNYQEMLNQNAEYEAAISNSKLAGLQAEYDKMPYIDPTGIMTKYALAGLDKEGALTSTISAIQNELGYTKTGSDALNTLYNKLLTDYGDKASIYLGQAFADTKDQSKAWGIFGGQGVDTNLIEKQITNYKALDDARASKMSKINEAKLQEQQRAFARNSFIREQMKRYRQEQLGYKYGGETPKQLTWADLHKATATANKTNPDSEAKPKTAGQIFTNRVGRVESSSEQKPTQTGFSDNLPNPQETAEEPSSIDNPQVIFNSKPNTYQGDFTKTNLILGNFYNALNTNNPSAEQAYGGVPNKILDKLKELATPSNPANAFNSNTFIPPQSFWQSAKTIGTGIEHGAQNLAEGISKRLTPTAENLVTQIQQQQAKKAPEKSKQIVDIAKKFNGKIIKNKTKDGETLITFPDKSDAELIPILRELDQLDIKFETIDDGSNTTILKLG